MRKTSTMGYGNMNIKNKIEIEMRFSEDVYDCFEYLKDRFPELARRFISSYKKNNNTWICEFKTD